MTVEPSAPSGGDRLLPWREVKALAGLSRTTAWRLQNAGDFPRPVAISPGRVAWRESDVAAWKARLAPRGAKAQTRRAAGPPAPATALPSLPAPQPRNAPPSTRSLAPRPRRRRACAPNQMSFDF